MGTTSNEQFIWHLFSNGKDITTKYGLIRAQITTFINRIGKATFIIDGNSASTEQPEGSDETGFIPGAEIKFTAGYDNQVETLFEGLLITQRLKLDNKEHAHLILECRDFAYPATQGRKNKLFKEEKDSDAIKKILKEYGLTAQVDDTGVQNLQLMQYHCTDWDFILSKAQAYGLQIIAEGKKISVAKPKLSEQAALTIAYKKDVIEFDGSLSSSDQYSKTIARCWDQTGQKAITVTAQKPSLNQQGDISPDKLSKDNNELLYQTSASLSEKSLQTWANARALWDGLSRFQGSILFNGSAMAKPGCLIKLEGIGKHYDGNAYIQSIEHTLQGSDWLTRAYMGFDPTPITEEQDVTAPLAGGYQPGISGLQIGKVKQISKEKDAEQFILVEIPLLNGTPNEIWARPAAYYASKEAGSFFMPEKGDEVVLDFVNNDPNYPIILGSLFSRKQAPPIEIDEKNLIKALVTKNKLKITFDDEKKIITIETPGKNVFVLDDDKKKITLSDPNKNTICMDNNGISIQSAKDLKLSAKGNIHLEASQSIENKANSDVKIEGLNINATAKMKVKINASAAAELSASGQTVVKGGVVMIN